MTAPNRTNAPPSGSLGAEAIRDTVKPRRWGSWYIAEHRLRVMRAYAQTVFLTAIGNPLLYLYALGVGLATLVDSNLGAGAVEGVSYLTFVAPALLCSTAITVAGEEFSYPILLGYKWVPVFYGMNATPIQPGQIINGVVISVFIRMFVTCGFFYIFMVVFGAIPSPIGFLVVFASLLTGVSFGAVLMGYVSTLTDDKGQIAMVMRFVILPMTLFSGTFFPLSVLPGYLQWIGWISPLWHGTELSRVFAYGMSEPIWLTALHLAYLSALLAFGWIWARRVAVRRLNK